MSGDQAKTAALAISMLALINIGAFAAAKANSLIGSFMITLVIGVFGLGILFLMNKVVVNRSRQHEKNREKEDV